MFIKASSEFQTRGEPIHTMSAEHKTLLGRYFAELATDAGVKSPDALAQQLLVIKEGAIVLAHLHEPAQVAEDSKAVANLAIESALKS